MFIGDYLKINKFIKNTILRTFLIYTYNIIAVNFNLMLPINVWTILVVGLFGIIGIIILNIIKIFGG